MQPEKQQITVAYGDGIGPEIMQSTLDILREAGAQIKPEVIEIGEEIYKKGLKAGIEPDSWKVIRKNKVFLKAPITTPQGGGVKSLNVTMRKTLGLFANVRPCMSYHPFVKTKHPDMDVVIVRENEEDTYGGIEHRQTFEVYQCLKLITLPGTERIVRYAFEYARTNNRKKVTCFTKDNIMKLTDGLFHDVFKKVADEYPNIESDNMIVDIGTARLADTPENFDVVVMPNLYGDIVSDVAAQIAGSVGLAGSANVGTECAMFEAIHGSAPDIAGQNVANPSGLLHGALMMLVHIGQPAVAERIHNAWLKTLEDGLHTPDIYHSDRSEKKVGTDEFTAALIERLGEKPVQLQPVIYSKKAP
ncbi:MAG: NADP-dependent isocitrate dehydrogenase, partial [Bacteroidetes bacterium]|nr:NADP-dependent isocitrate dehydrogenase [Bacteroidota bacterium]